MRALRRPLVLALALAVVAVAWPASLGGTASYVRTYGSSMEPAFKAGDLAVVRADTSYHVGDVVAYRSPQLRRVVLHRIVARDGDAYVFRGDNNDFLDAEHLPARHLLGRLAVRVPGGGSAFTWLANPIHATVAATGAGALVAALRVRRRAPRPNDPTTTRGVPMQPKRMDRIHGMTPILAAGGALLLLAAGYALLRSSTEPERETIAFTQSGSFTYSAPSSSGLYPDGFRTGEVVFTRLATRVTIAFTHALDTRAPTSVAGTVGVDVTISGPSGWERTVTLVEPQPLGTTAVDAVLDLDAIRAIATETASVTGTPASALQLSVTPHVDLAGTVADEHIATRFEPTLTFTLDPVALRLLTPIGERGDPITVVDEDAVLVDGTRAASLPVPLVGRQVSVSTVRQLGFVGGLTLLGIAGALVHAARRRDDDEVARITARYRHLLLPIRGPAGAQHRTVVEVTTIADLVRVAKHHDQLVHHHCNDGDHSYLVEAQGTTYRYVPGTAIGDDAQPAARPPAAHHATPTTHARSRRGRRTGRAAI